MKAEPNILSGYLLATSASRNEVRATILSTPHISEDGHFVASQWEQFRITSAVPLLGEETTDSPFRYPLVCRRSEHHFLLLSLGRKSVDHFLSHVAPTNDVVFYRTSLGVDRAVRLIATGDTKYALTFVHARVAAFGNTLRSVSFYGDDISEADFFRDHLSLFNCYTCGIRAVVDAGEIIRISSDGHISFTMSSVLSRDARQKRLREVEEVLLFLRVSGFVSDPI